ncbi:MAG: 2-oxo acid dehydrogenase subunit E2 [Gammaproteobacteria bacterium]|nr:2-oxo acid dehydrogenase subunit E2 [Gammaproteobacteria bacterium]
MAGIVEIRFPEDQQEGTEATVTRWLVAEGDDVAAHDPVVEIETDKVVIEVAAPEAGRIADIKIRQDEEANPGDVLCTLNTAADAAAAPEKTAPAAPENEPASTETASVGEHSMNDQLSPAVRQRVLQHGLDISGIAGSGRDGRITLQDVEALIADREKQPATELPSTNISPPAVEGSETIETIAHDKMRKRIADNMVASLMHTAPHVTAVFEADLSAVLRHRAANKESYASAGTPLTLTAYFVAAAVAAIHKVPRVNSRWFDDHLEIYHHVNIGIGTALGDQGLIVPVLQQVQNMGLRGIAAGLTDLVGRARDNKLKPADVRGGTFTISNHGVSGSLFATPIIINQPQSAILGVGKIEKRIKIKDVDGEDVMVVRPMCYVSLTIDHRVVDAYQTNAFLTELVSTLENWS